MLKIYVMRQALNSQRPERGCEEAIRTRLRFASASHFRAQEKAGQPFGLTGSRCSRLLVCALAKAACREGVGRDARAFLRLDG